MWWILGFLALIIIGAITASNKRKEAIKRDKEKLLKAGISPGDFILTGAYLGGITNITRPSKGTKLLCTPEGFDLFITEEDQYSDKGHVVETRKIGSILNKEIKNIYTEDKSTSEKRMSVGNIAMFGPLGLAMRKTKDHDIAFLIIKLNDGRFESEAVFCIESKISNSKGKCFEIANEAKSRMISHLKTIPQ